MKYSEFTTKRLRVACMTDSSARLISMVFQSKNQDQGNVFLSGVLWNSCQSLILDSIQSVKR